MQAKQDGREKTGWRPPAQLVDHAPDCARKRPKVPFWKAVTAATDNDQIDRKHKPLVTTIYVTGTRIRRCGSAAGLTHSALTCKRYDAAQKSITDNRNPPEAVGHSSHRETKRKRWGRGGLQHEREKEEKAATSLQSDKKSWLWLSKVGLFS